MTTKKSLEEVWHIMKRKDFATLHDLVLQHQVLQREEDVAVFENLFQLDIAIPFVLLLWHLVDDTTPEELATCIADCLSFNPPLHFKRAAVVRLLNYWLKRDNLPLLSEQR